MLCQWIGKSCLHITQATNNSGQNTHVHAWSELYRQVVLMFLVDVTSKAGGEITGGFEAVASDMRLWQLRDKITADDRWMARSWPAGNSSLGSPL